VRLAEEILRLACHKKQKPVHYVSTMSVLPQSSILPPSGEHEWIMKEEGVPTWRGLDLGYTQSKWVAERLVRAAGSRGVPVSIYRPTVTYGQAETGEGNSRDFLYRLIYSCGQLGFAPNVDWNLNLVPVDFVARGILELSMNSESIGRVFHLANEQPNSMRDVIDCIVSSGLPIEKVPYEDWRRRLLQAPPDNALAALAGGLPHNSPHTHPGIEFRCDNASLVLRPKGITCPEVKGATLQKYVTKVLEAAMHPAGKVNASI